MAIFVGDLPVVSPLLEKMSFVGVVADVCIDDPNFAGDRRRDWVTTMLVGLFTLPAPAAVDCACAASNCDVTGAERTISDVAVFVPAALPPPDPVGIACTLPLPGFFVIITFVTT